MVIIIELEKASNEQIQRIAELHKRAFPAFFLTQLGIPFLRTLYSGYMEDPESGIIVAEENDTIIGFIAYSKNYPQFFKRLIKHHLVKFAFCSLGAAIRHPSFIIRLFGAFKKSESVVKEERYVELASICVDPESGGCGIGSSLIDYLKSNLDFSIYSYINLETDAKGNDVVNRFYRKNKFILVHEYTTSEGRVMNEYRYAPGERR